LLLGLPLILPLVLVLGVICDHLAATGAVPFALEWG
jgi:hypothetical protein